MSIINNIKAILIGEALLDIMTEYRIRMNILPRLNPYYYKIKKMDKEIIKEVLK